MVLVGKQPYTTNFFKPIANGYAFATADGSSTTSLNVFKDTLADYYFNKYSDIRADDIVYNNFDHTLTNWIDQGIFLYNISLSAGVNNPKRDINKWSNFSKETIKFISQETNALTFVFIGKEAQSYNKYVDLNKHYVINSPKPIHSKSKNSFRNQNIFKQIDKIKFNLDETTFNWISNDEARLFD